MFRFRISTVVLAVFSAFTAVPAHAALIDFSFSGEVININTSDVFFSNLFSVSAPGSGHLVLNYDGNPATAVINSFSAMIGSTNFSMANGADHLVRLENNVPHNLQLQDLATFDTDDVLGPSFFGYSASFMRFRFQDASRTVFGSDTPSVSELTGLSDVDYVRLVIFFEDGLGQAAGGVVLIPTDRVSVDVISPVPVPAAVWLFGTALIGFVGMSRRRKVA